MYYITYIYNIITTCCTTIPLLMHNKFLAHCIKHLEIDRVYQNKLINDNRTCYVYIHVVTSYLLMYIYIHIYMYVHACGVYYYNDVHFVICKGG